MQFSDVKQILEAGLATQLIAYNAEFSVVRLEQWQGECPKPSAGPQQHVVNGESRVCLDCCLIYVPEERLSTASLDGIHKVVMNIAFAYKRRHPRPPEEGVGAEPPLPKPTAPSRLVSV